MPHNIFHSIIVGFGFRVYLKQQTVPSINVVEKEHLKWASLSIFSQTLFSLASILIMNFYLDNLLRQFIKDLKKRL